MAQRSKLSGAALAAELTDLSFPQSAPLPSPPPQPAEAADEGPSAPFAAAQVDAEYRHGASPPVPTHAKRASAPKSPRGGRPAKAGVDGIPVNVRLSQADHLALAKLAGKLMVPGRPLPTVQDVVRTLIRGALREPELAFRLSNRAD